MKDNDDDIKFEMMPDFGTIFATPDKHENNPSTQTEKEYDSLYEELEEKCYPGNFKDAELNQFNIANDIYEQLKQKGNDISEIDLKHLRDRAIDELGLYISASKSYKKLISLLDPENYIKIEPYDRSLVETSKKIYDQLKDFKNDIRALEKLENQPETQAILDIYYYHNIAPEEYLIKYPSGKYIDEVNNLIIQKEEDYFQGNTAFDYLSQYPCGIHKEEAEFFKAQRPSDYIKKYPEGRYIKTAKEERISNILGYSFAIVMVVAVVAIIIATQF